MKASGREIEKGGGGGVWSRGRERSFLCVVSIKEEKKTRVDEIADRSQKP